MATKRDYYEILGVSKGASAADIKQAYKKKALEWHPDRNKSADATEKFKEINEAFEVLSNPQKKQMYDQFGHTGMGGQYGSAGRTGQGPFGGYTYSTGNINDIFESMGFGGQSGFSDPFDIFESFFGGRSPFSQAQQQRRHVYHIKITFDEAFRGVEKRVKLDGENRTVKIPAGVASGNRIRFQNFDLAIEVEPSKLYQREGADLYYEHTVSYTDAILGTTIEVPTPDKKVQLRVKPGTQSNTVIRIKDFGMPHVNTHMRGSFYTVLKVHIPEHVSGREKKLLEELKKIS